MSKEKTPVSVNLRDDHKEWMDAENINRSALVNDLIEQYRNGPAKAEYAAKEYRKQQLQVDIEKARAEINTKKPQLERIEEELNEIEDREHREKQDRIEKAANALRVDELNTTGPYVATDEEVVKQEAEKVGCTVAELKEEAIRQHNE
jgi:hypothetical protein